MGVEFIGGLIESMIGTLWLCTRSQAWLEKAFGLRELTRVPQSVDNLRPAQIAEWRLIQLCLGVATLGGANEEKGWGALKTEIGIHRGESRHTEV